MIAMKQKRLLDVVMTIGLLLCMGYRMTGECLHEWLGLAVLVLFIGHLIGDRYWFKTLFKQKKSLVKGFQNVVNGLVLFMALGLLVSSCMISNQVLTFVPLNHLGEGVGHTPHTVCATLGFLVLSMHLGLHWSMLTAGWRKHWPISAKKWVKSAGEVFIVGVGIAAMVHSHYFTLIFSDTSEVAVQTSPVLFFVEYGAILFLWLWLANTVRSLLLARQIKLKKV